MYGIEILIGLWYYIARDIFRMQRFKSAGGVPSDDFQPVRKCDMKNKIL